MSVCAESGNQTKLLKKKIIVIKNNPKNNNSKLSLVYFRIQLYFKKT